MDCKALPVCRDICFYSGQSRIYAHLDEAAKERLIPQTDSNVTLGQHCHILTAGAVHPRRYKRGYIFWLPDCRSLAGKLVNRPDSEWTLRLFLGLRKERVHTSDNDWPGNCRRMPTTRADCFSIRCEAAQTRGYPSAY